MPPTWLAALGADGVALEPFASDGAEVWTAALTFVVWPGRPLGMREDCNKRNGRVVGSTGELSCAEVEIVKRLRAAHWEGGWRNTFGGCGRARWGDFMIGADDLPARAADLVTGVRARLGRSGGVPDVIAWRRREVVFVESKSPSDNTGKQREWVAAALELGLARDAFALVKWKPA